MRKIDKEMLNTKEAAIFLGVSTKTIYRMEKKGLIQSVRTPGGQRRFSKKALEDYLNTSKSITAPQNPSKYKKENSLIPPKVEENKVLYTLFDFSEYEKFSSITRLEELVSTTNIQTHKNYYDKCIDIFRWIDEWDFKNYHTKTYTHGFHTYPAMFIPQVARKLIEIFSKEKDTVCDIFCGSGTTLVESSLLNRNSIGIELNPLAVLIAKVKTTPIDPQLLIINLKKILHEHEKIKLIEKPFFNNINFWFSQEVIEELAKLKQAIHSIDNEIIRNFFLVCFSEVTRIVSFTRHNEFKLFRDKEKLNKSLASEVLKEFIKKCEENILGMKEYISEVKPEVKINIIYGDSTKDNGIPPESIDFIITSPPYGDSRTTVAYGQFSRLPAQWLGLLPPNINDIDKDLLGGKNNVNLNDPILDLSDTLKISIKIISEKDKKRAKDVLSFYKDLYNAILQAYKILRPKKYFCLIVGNRTVKELTLKTDEIICELGEKVGFIAQGIIYRNIPNKRMPLKNSPTNERGKTGLTMQKESIVLLKKL